MQNARREAGREKDDGLCIYAHGILCFFVDHAGRLWDVSPCVHTHPEKADREENVLRYMLCGELCHLDRTDCFRPVEVAGAYILWTGIFTKIAAEPIHDAASASEQTEMPADEAHEQAQEAIELPAAAPPILFCRRCGSKLRADSAFCSRCGLEVAKGGAHSAMPKL